MQGPPELQIYSPIFLTAILSHVSNRPQNNAGHYVGVDIPTPLRLVAGLVGEPAQSLHGSAGHDCLGGPWGDKRYMAVSIHSGVLYTECLGFFKGIGDIRQVQS